jgi:transcriptional repressor NrdR
MQALKQIDQVAYIRFASVYREFKDVRDFVQEMAPMLEEGHSHGAGNGSGSNLPWPTDSSAN